MRPFVALVAVLAALLLAACSSYPQSPLDAAQDAAPEVSPDVPVEADAGPDAALADLACVPACPAGQHCAAGACVADPVDAGPDVTDAALAYQSCEPVGSTCAGGLQCLAVAAGATRGICTRTCARDPECTALLNASGVVCAGGMCLIWCGGGSAPPPPNCTDRGTGRCVHIEDGGVQTYCAP